MNVLVFAVLVVILQASPAVPRKAPDSPISAGKKVQADTSHSKAPAAKPESSVKMQSTQNDEASTKEQRKENTQQSVRISEPVTVAVKRDWADWGYWFFNLGLLIVGALQVILLCLTLRAIRRQAAIMLRQWQAMRRQARVMEGQLTQMEIAGKQTGELIEHAAENTRTARESIILTHRPRITVRNVYFAWKHILQRMTTVARLNETRFDDGQLGGAFFMVNTGNQPATVIGLEQYLCFDERLPSEHPSVSGANQQTVNVRLNPGQAHRWPFRPTAITNWSKDEPINLGRPMYAIGKITYVDELGNRRETGFCRRLDYKGERLVTVNDPDYEYTD